MKRAQPADSLLVIDIGNSRIGLAVWDAEGLHHVQRVPTAQPNTWPVALDAICQAAGRTPTQAVLGSVAPETTGRFATLVEERCGLAAFRVRDDLPLPLPLEIDNPLEVGVDRVCCAAAAWDRTRGTCAVASFGTATTIDCVSADGSFLGGVILPGLDMSCEALYDHTAQLPRVTPAAPNGPFARNTHDAIVNGVCYAAAGALREVVERFATELREWPRLVVTGGNALLVSGLADFIDAVIPDLCLLGIALTYQHAVAAAE
ncbi:MAG: type III pantothenate kinase [Phycisphaerae bacterium]|jgi:type III pantothenate kinase